MENSFYKLTLITHKGDKPLDEYLHFIHVCAVSGLTCVQLREKNLSYKNLLIFGKQLKSILDPLGVSLIVNDDPHLALELDADGVHLGQTDGNIFRARTLLGKNKWIGVSIDTRAQLHLANELPINYVGIGAIFPTQHKPNVATLWGCDRLKELSTLSKHPVIAIGGINESNVDEVMDSNIHGIAAIGAFHQAQDPAQVTQLLRTKVEERAVYA